MGTKQKIIDAMMSLIRAKGYVASTTKDIATLAGVNECTIFRYFKSKKEIVISGMEQEKWRGDITEELFKNVSWEMETDLAMFMRSYLERITEEFVQLSIGLRAPQIYDEVAPLIMKIPSAFITALVSYFEKMKQKDIVAQQDFESLAIIIFSSTFGFTFLKASFENKLSKVTQEQYITDAARLYAAGIMRKS